MKDTIDLYYSKLANMGDLLNGLIIEKSFGYKVVRNSFLTGEMSAIGSCLGQYTYHGNVLMRLQQLINGMKYPHVSVWGTGFIDYADCRGRFFKRDMEFCALRGELSRKAAEKMTGKRLDIPTGDAGILADELLDSLPEKKYSLGIIPHICDLNDPMIDTLLKSYDNSLFINVKDEPIEVVRQIAQCRCIISSSLHGLIVADSFNIPNLHIVFSDRPKGDGFKYDDYYSAYNVPHISRDLQSDPIPNIDYIYDNYRITPKMVEDKKRLMKESFPFPNLIKGDA